MRLSKIKHKSPRNGGFCALFLNREEQAETGYVDLVHRQYDPTAPHFLSVEPKTDNQEHLSVYQYSYNNPVRFSDPDGLEGEDQGGCQTCPPYTDPMQPMWHGFSQAFEGASIMIDRLSVATTHLVEKTFSTNGNSVTIGNLTSTETRTNLHDNYSYIKYHNTNEGNTSPLTKTTVKNETIVSGKKEVDLGIMKGSVKNSVTNGGKVTLEGKAEVRASKLWTVGISSSANTKGDTKSKIEIGTGIGSSKAKAFTQTTNTLKSISAEIGVVFENQNTTRNTKTTNSASLKYTQQNP